MQTAIKEVTFWRDIVTYSPGAPPLNPHTPIGMYQISDPAYALMKERQSVTYPAHENHAIALTLLSPRDFGLTAGATTHEWLSPEFMKEWSLTHLIDQEVFLTEPEDTFWLCRFFSDQPKREVLTMGMKPLTDTKGKPWIFEVKRLATEELPSYVDIRDHCWCTVYFPTIPEVFLDSKFIFRLVEREKR